MATPPPLPGSSLPKAVRVRTQRMQRRLGEMLIQEGLLNDQKLQQALSMCARTGERLGVVLIRAGFVRPEQVASTLAKQFGIDYLAPDRLGVQLVEREVAGQLGIEKLRQLRILPVVHEGEPRLLIADPLDTAGTDWAEAAIGKRPYLLTTASAVEIVLQVISFEALDAERIIESAREGIDQGELGALLDYILGRAVLEHVSDVHIEPTGLTTLVRFRLDGQLRTAISLPRERHENLANVLFGRAGVDLSDFNRLHDGRFNFAFAGRRLDVRFASSPTVEGPMIVLRILDDTRSLATLEELGFSKANLSGIAELIRHPHGLILVVGPTGSGKTTTLYSCLSKVNDGETKILTIEDPVEIRIPSIQQVQVNEKAGVTFAKAVRAFMRQDPDVILVGEIRDEETAREAFRAANTGHLVLSTLHANSAAEAVGRLVDLGMEPYQVASTLLGCLSQRLVRKVCPRCRKAEALPIAELLPQAAEVVATSERAKASGRITVAKLGEGCGSCREGRVGRTVLGEVLTLTPEVRSTIIQRASNDAVVEVARREGFRTMLDDALGRIMAGEVEVREAESVLGPITTRAQ
jgi:type IV pilus assembly protein PilB